MIWRNERSSDSSETLSLLEVGLITEEEGADVVKEVFAAMKLGLMFAQMSVFDETK